MTSDQNVAGSVPNRTSWAMPTEATIAAASVTAKRRTYARVRVDVTLWLMWLPGSRTLEPTAACSSAVNLALPEEPNVASSHTAPVVELHAADEEGYRVRLADLRNKPVM